MEVIERDAFDDLLAALSRRGYTVIGPRVREHAVVLEPIETSDDLPIGYTDEQDGGRYRLKQTGQPTLFGYSVGPHSLKNHLYPSHKRLWRARCEEDGGIAIEPNDNEIQPLAVVGIRSCDLHAVHIHDAVFTKSRFTDTDYRARREGLFVVVVNCTHAGGTCFCASMETGPRATHGYDLALTEVYDGARHYFTVEWGSELGAAVLEEVPHRAAAPEEERAAAEGVENASREMGRSMDTGGIRELFAAHMESPQWEEVAGRCLTCGNCTQVCPTCFCSTVEDTSDLSNHVAERWRHWDSCFTLDFTYLHGGVVRKTGASRYRQWISHKLATWHDQFGMSGCVGCGRCITWCPVGIDITEEVAKMRGQQETP